MNAKVAILQILSIIILIYVQHLGAECNVCSNTTHMACVSQSEYRFCVNNTPSGTVTTCPSGYVCSTATSVICLPNAAGVEPTCSDCNKCDINLVFACTGVSTYSLCSGQTTPTGVSGTCGANQVCNINSPRICVDAAANNPTCPTSGSIGTTTSTTTTATPTFPSTIPTYAQYFCNVMRQNTRFPVPTNFDNTCKKYIYCFRTFAGVWSGQIYTCAGSTYFDPNSLYCVNNKPSSC
ncbi:uncharacterized protein ACRADG_003715 [Cochliomyia hominivorax]